MNASIPQLTTLLAQQCSYTRSAETISIHTDALRPEFTILLARQYSYTRSVEIIFVPTDALCILTDTSGTTTSSDTLQSLAISTHTFARRWQHARGLRLALALLHSPNVGNALGGCASYWHSYIHSMLAIRSGAAPSNPMLATRSRAMLTC
jgi:hypothetical protein